MADARSIRACGPFRSIPNGLTSVFARPASTLSAPHLQPLRHKTRPEHKADFAPGNKIRALAQYAAAEAAVHSEIAKQYPNFNIGPGYTYEERNSFFTVCFSTSPPVFNRNQGPIAEAEGRRKEAAAAFLQTQAQVIARSERALANYTAALKEVAEAQSLYQLQETQLQTVQQNIRADSDNS